MIAGEMGGLHLVVGKGANTRPTTDRVKESVFGALGDERLAGANVLDGFSGCGALAIEALSRGAESATLVDRDPRAVDAIRRNLISTKCGDRAMLQRRGFSGYLKGRTPESPFDLVFLDPPYEMSGAELGVVLELLTAPGWLSPDAGVVIERPATAGAPPIPQGWEVAWERTYGDTLVVLAGPGAGEFGETGAPDDLASPALPS